MGLRTLVGQVGEPAHTHTGVFRMCSWAGCAHTGANVSASSYSYSWGRVSTLLTGRTDTWFMPWSPHVHTRITHRHGPHRPLVLGPQVGPEFTCICSEAVGSPRSWAVSNLLALLQKQSLAFHVNPETALS